MRRSRTHTARLELCVLSGAEIEDVTVPLRASSIAERGGVSARGSRGRLEENARNDLETSRPDRSVTLDRRRKVVHKLGDAEDLVREGEAVRTLDPEALLRVARALGCHPGHKVVLELLEAEKLPAIDRREAVERIVRVQGQLEPATRVGRRGRTLGHCLEVDRAGLGGRLSELLRV